MSGVNLALQPSARIPAYLAFTALGAYAALLAVLQSPSDPQNAVLFGYSTERLLLAAGLFFSGCALLFLTWILARVPEHSLRWWEMISGRTTLGDVLQWGSCALGIVLLILLLLPSYRLGGFFSYVERLFPLLVWLAVSGGCAAVILFFARRAASFSSVFHASRLTIRISLLALVVFALLWILIALTGLGIRDPEDYWYGAGVPVLGLQILFAALVGAAALRIEARCGEKFIRDRWIFAALWLAAAFFWMREPLIPNYFFPDTAKNPLYPYSDSATYDTASQFALIGQGLFNGEYFDRPVYSALLVILHRFAEQDYDRLMTLQAALFAVFPAIVYLIGRELHSRALGLSAATLLILRGINSLVAAKWIDTASPKMMLTDFAAAIGTAVFILLALKWLHRPMRFGFAISAGGALGITIMLRTHILLLLPVALLAAFLFIRPIASRAAVGSLLLVAGMLISTLPWDVRNRSNGIPFFYVYYSRFELILRHRYGIEDAYRPPPRTPKADTHADSLRALYRPALSGGHGKVCESQICSIAHHFFRNGITSIVFLPSSFVLDDLWNTIKVSAPFWRQDWEGGGVGFPGAALIIFDLAMISLGIGAIWAHSRTAGLFSTFIPPAYLMTNALAFTSGGRYIVPVDWIFGVFYILGLLQAAAWFMTVAGLLPLPGIPGKADRKEEESLPQRVPLGRVSSALFSIFLIGSLIPAVELPFSRRYQALPPDELLASLDQQGWLHRAGFDRSELTEFLKQPGARIALGRILHPRYYPAGAGEPDQTGYFYPRDYPRLVFTLIGPYEPGAQGVVIPGFKPNVTLHASDAVVIGCWNDAAILPHLDGLVVIVMNGGGYIYDRSPGAKMQCPLPEP